jgi:inhibitor of cysteine peptidase
MKKRALAFLCLSWSLGAFAKEHREIVVDAKAPTFEVALRANPTTGYQWRIVSYDKAYFNYLESHYVSPLNHRIGAAGKMIFVFSPKKGKTKLSCTTMTFRYARAWESDTSTSQDVTIMFKVKKNH